MSVFIPKIGLTAEFLSPFNFPSAFFIFLNHKTRNTSFYTGWAIGVFMDWVRLLINLKVYNKLTALHMRTFYSPEACPGPWPEQFPFKAPGLNACCRMVRCWLSKCF